MIVHINPNQSILPASFSTTNQFLNQFSQIDKLLKEKLELLQVSQHGLKPTIPPSFFKQYPDKNNILIPQGFAFIPAASLVPSPKESAPPDESA